jgi:Cu-Zn family superoxide dismutase
MHAHRIGHRIEQVILAVPFVLVAGCAGEAPPKQATATLESRSGSTVTGKAVFTAVGTKVTMELTVAGATPGDHAVHLHAVGDCGAADATSAMGHFNPDMMNHGLPTATPHHLGDCGNFQVAADGTGKLTFTADWALGTGEATDIANKAVIVHAMADDGMTQMPPGNAGARVACGVIKM